MKRLLFVLFCLFLGFACKRSVHQENAPKIHKDSVVSKEQLIDYMTEIFLIEAAIYKAQHDGKNIKDYTSVYYTSFFEKNELTRQKLKMSVEFYIGENQMEGILQKIVENLTEIDIHTPDVKTHNANENESKKPISMPPWLENIPID